MVEARFSTVDPAAPRSGSLCDVASIPAAPMLLGGTSEDGDRLIVPLRDGQTTLGAIQLWLEDGRAVEPDELALLATIGSEIAGARRRTREEGAIYELERAIAEERARIARDIHDGIAQTLAFRRLRIDLWLDWIDTDRDRLRDELIDNKRVLREQIAELRRAIFALRPIQFDELGFVGGLHRYVEEFAAQQNWTATVDIARTPALPPELEAVCFRVVQEALTNAAKHAGASRVEVVIAPPAGGGLGIAVRDDGQGFEAASGAPDGRVGLRQMRERLEALGGHLSVLSHPGAGAELRAWVPLVTPTSEVTA